jgi:uncharacterized protein (TIGR02444 family)
MRSCVDGANLAVDCEARQADNMLTLPLHGPHWIYALDLYGRPGVSDACLLLQDRAGVDVNILQVALHAAAQRGIVLSARDLQEADAAVQAWRQEIVLPLRAIRRRLKEGPEPAPGPDAEALRTKVKGAELVAEQIEQALIAAWIERQPRPMASAPVEIQTLIDGVVEYFAHCNNLPSGTLTDPGVQRAKETIARSAMASLNSDDAPL